MFIRFLCALACPVCLLGAEQLSGKEQQAKKLAEEVLHERRVVVRVYPDGNNHPKRFEKIIVPLTGLKISFEHLWPAFCQTGSANTFSVSKERLLKASDTAKAALGSMLQSAEAGKGKIGPILQSAELTIQRLERCTLPGDSTESYVGKLRATCRGIRAASYYPLEPVQAVKSSLDQLTETAGKPAMLPQTQSRTYALAGPMSRVTRFRAHIKLIVEKLPLLAEAAAAELRPAGDSAEAAVSAIDDMLAAIDAAWPTLKQILRCTDLAIRKIEDMGELVDGVRRRLRYAIAVVQAGQQTDEAVATVLRDFIVAEPLRCGRSFSIWPEPKGRYVHNCVFRNALEEPIPNATVEIMIGRGPDRPPWACIGTATLDEMGQISRLKSCSTLSAFSFFVLDTDCGRVRAKRLPLNTNNAHEVYFAPVLPKDKWCVFRDGTGRPIPNATVKIFRRYQWDWEKSTLVQRTTLDEHGRLRPPTCDPKLRYSFFTVSHPDYGMALAEPTRFVRPEAPLRGCTVPLVRIGSQADERSIWGKVVDSNDNPISEAIIECWRVRTAGGGSIVRLVRSCGPEFRTLTDKQGQFAFYLPPGPETGLELVPPGAKYSVRVTAKPQLGLRAYRGLIPSGEETTITLRARPSKDYFPVFVFEDESGPVSDYDRLKKIKLVHRRGSGSSNTSYEHWVERGIFEPGIYSASATWDGRVYVFEPVDLTVERPDTVVFRIKEIRNAEAICRGRVVHGITGEPISGAIVMKQPMLSDLRLLKLTDEQVIAVKSSGPELAEDQAVLEMLNERDPNMITQTDSKGIFQISFPAELDTGRKGIIAIKKDFLGAQQKLRYFADRQTGDRSQPRWTQLQPDPDGYIRLLDLKLFPAGTIVVEPNVPSQTLEATLGERAKYEGIRISWRPSSDDAPAWVEDFGAYFYPIKNKGGSVFYTDALGIHGMQRAYVPAGLALKITMHVLFESQWDHVIIPDVKLRQGQVLDLGTKFFGPAIRVAAKVVDPQGRAVDGVSVRCFVGDYFRGQQAVTNEQGIAWLHVPRYSNGKFVVQHYERMGEKPISESTPYEVGGDEDAGREFILPLSDEFLELLFE